MSLDGDISLLRRVKLFSELPTEQLRLIAFSAVRLELVPGQVLFRSGPRPPAATWSPRGGSNCATTAGAR